MENKTANSTIKSLIFYLFFSIFFLGPAPTQAITPVPTNIDLLSKACLKMGITPTVIDGLGQPYQSLDSCNDDDFTWQLGLQSEASYGSQGNCQNFPAVNTANSPTQFEFIDRGNGTYTARLSTDLKNTSHPCGANYFTWYVLMHQDSNYRYPLPNDLASSHKVFFTKNKINGASRLIAAMSGFIKTHPNSQPEPFSIEIALNIDPEWGDNYPNSPLISSCSLSECGSNHFFLDGSYFDLIVPTGVETTINITWYKIYNFLIQQNLLSPPYLNQPAYVSTGGISLGYEINNYSSENSYQAQLLQSDFVIKSTLAPSDLNQDGTVNIFDYNILVAGYGTEYDIFDYNELVTNYEK